MKKFVSDLKSGRINRRQANRMLAGLGIGLVSLPVLRRPAKADNDIIYFTWEGYEIPELHPDYAAKYGDSPPYSIFGTEEEALQKIRAGYEATLGHPCTYAVTRWNEAGIIQPIDTSRIPRYADVWPGLKTIAGTQTADGQPLYVPFDWGNSSVLYRTDLVEGEESWNMLFDERYKGRIGMSSDPEACVEVAALALGYKNIFDLDDDQLAEVRKMLQKQKELLRFHWDSETAMQQAMASGEIVVAYSWNSAYASLKAAGIPVAYANPKEGIFTWACGLVLFKDPVGSVDAAYEFIDAMLDPEVGKYMIEEYGYGHSNMKSFELADPAAMESLGIQRPADLFERGIFFEAVPSEITAKYTELFNEVFL